ILLQNCLFVLYNGEGIYRATKAYKKRPLESVFMSYTTAHRYADFDTFFVGTEPGKRAPQIATTSLEVFTEIRDVLVPIFDRLKPTELEFLAAATIAIWSIGSARNSEQIVKMSDVYHKRVFDELHTLYRDEFKLDNYASRMGDLMSLVNSLEQTSVSLINFLRLFDVFNVFEEGSFTSEIIAPARIEEEISDDE
ncbi:hypothetical protein PMAYCL1PPCAC_21493, partial [Pristionchus mayeri]